MATIGDFSFKVEYARTGRASCKLCKSLITKESLRLAAMVQSHFFDGKEHQWFHETCFFEKQRPKSTDDISNFENIRYEDQQRIKQAIVDLRSSAVIQASGFHAVNAAKKDYGIEYSKSGRATCAGCRLKIAKEEIRVKKTVYDTEVGMKFGGQPIWHHLECFAEIRYDVGWLEKGEAIPGFESLSVEDKGKVIALLPAIISEGMPEAKKVKLDIKKEDPEEQELEAEIAKQTKEFFRYHDNIKRSGMTTNEMKQILEDNDQIVPEGDSHKVINLLCDILTFGALGRCEKCFGQFHFSKSGYLCTGNPTEWVKCANFVKEPQRFPCGVNDELREKYPFLSKYEAKISQRSVKNVRPSIPSTIAEVKMEDELYAAPKVKREKPALYQLNFAIIGLKDREGNIKKAVCQLGGNVVSKISPKIAAVFSNEESIEKMGKRMQQAKDNGIQVIGEDFLDAVKDDSSRAISYIKSKSICDWGTDPQARIFQTRFSQRGGIKYKSRSIHTNSVPKSKKLKLKGGIVVDPDSKLVDVAHVYANDKGVWNVALSLMNSQKKKNSYYKLQLLEEDKGNGFWLFQSWGRIGTTIGGNKVVRCNSLMEAQNLFLKCYLRKTGNLWENRANFQKNPDLMYPIDVDYGADDEKIVALGQSDKVSKLPTRVQELIKLMFDVNMMRRVMLEFELDLEKMPLGKLSQKQLQFAYKVLTEIAELIKSGGSTEQFIDCTNRFYTLIPHNFGINNPPILNTAEQVAYNSLVLDSLMEIEFAYNMLQNEESKENNPIDQHYEQLKTDIKPLDRDSEEFKVLEKYVRNTHAETHRMYDLEIVDIFKVAREGEERRYAPFNKLHNRKLLWHGSRLTNFAGIMSHGLKIAPPEAPTTGYMFGRGIYFADMVSKSANYCFTSKESNTGLLILSEVALGDMMECHEAEYVTKLPNGKHSTKGVGRNQPNPEESHFREDGVEIPLGKPVTSNVQSSLLYNEFVVYDVSQVNIQYLFRLNFIYKY